MFFSYTRRTENISVEPKQEKQSMVVSQEIRGQVQKSSASFGFSDSPGFAIGSTSACI